MPWKEKKEVDLRHAFVTRALSSNSNISDLCREYGISRTAGYKWIKRFKEQGYDGLTNLSRRPLSCPHEVSIDMVLDIVALKAKHTNWGPKKIHTLIIKQHGSEKAPSLSTVTRVLDRAGLVTRRRKRPKVKLKKKEMIKPNAPNDVWTLDFMGWWRTMNGCTKIFPAPYIRSEGDGCLVSGIQLGSAP